MEAYQVVFSVLSAVILFLFGLSSFTQELRSAAGNRLQTIMQRLTKNRFVAILVGMGFTATIQSSTAVSSLAVSLVDAGVLSFQGAIAILLGSYIGTTATAWLVSLKLLGIGPFFIVFGTIISALPIRAKVFGKAIFYFGFIFFSLDLVSGSLGPLKDSPSLVNFLLRSADPSLGILTGIILTVVLQSSAVVTGLVIIFVQQELLLPEHSVPLVLGANIGTTATALFASLSMGKIARKTATANTLMNAFGVALFYPFLDPFTRWIMGVAPTPAIVVASAHLAFNVVIVVVFTLTLTPFVRFMDRLFDEPLLRSEK